MLTVRMPKAMFDEIERIAIGEDRLTADTARRLLRRGLDASPAPKRATARRR
jgi:hypothetical protein